MARTDPQINLRIPQELKARIEEAAKANSRSMNAEIVARLQTSLDEEPKRLELEKAMAHFLEKAQDAQSTLQSVIERREREKQDGTGALKENGLYILLDTNGYPIAWNEVFELLRTIKRAGGFEPAEVHTHIITPDLESSSRRHQQAVALARKLRAAGKSQAIDSGDEEQGEEVPGVRKGER